MDVRVEDVCSSQSVVQKPLYTVKTQTWKDGKWKTIKKNACQMLVI